jgi:hypothetical protein
VRTRPLATAALVATVVACGLVVRAVADDEDPSVHGGTSAEAGDCPVVTEDQRDFRMPEPLPGAPDTITDGAERVWLCEGPGSPIDVPADVLTSGADGLAEIINAMPPAQPEQGCNADGGPGWRLRFQYADGTVADAVGQLYGCGDVQVGATLHTGDRDGVAVQEFVRLLRDQRAAAAPPPAPEQPGCAYDDETVFGPISPVGRAEEMVAASLCAWDGRGVGGPADHVAVVPAQELATLMADYSLNTSPEQPTARECRADRQLAIQGVTAWGDRVLMSGSCGVIQAVGTRPTGAADGATAYWRPGPEARAALDRLLGTEPTTVAACPPDPDSSLDADLPDGEAGVVPPGASSVRLCVGPGVGFREPVDALTDGVDGIATLVSGLELLDLSRGCTGELGVGYRLVFSYPDGTALDAIGRLYGCQDVDVAGAILTPAEVPWDAFRDALRVQRTTATPPGRPAGPSCRPYGDLGSPVATAADMTRAVLCLTTPAGEATHRSRMDAEDLRVLLTDRAAVDEPGPACTQDPVPFAIRGTTAWRDRVVLSGVCGLLADNGRIPDGPATYWQPGPRAQAVLDRLVERAEELRRID